MSNTNYPPTKPFTQHAHINQEQYKKLYQDSIDNPETFWATLADEFISWNKKWNSVLTGDFHHANIRWFDGATLNVCYNCVDRHLKTHANQTAIIWESDNPDISTTITYKELHTQVCQFANVLKKRGIKKGDRVCIYMPMIPEAATAMLACARIGAIHSVVFGGFSAKSLKDRILDADCVALITADVGMRGGKTIPLKENADIALTDCPNVHSVIVVKHPNSSNKELSNPTRDIWLHDAITSVSDDCPPEIMQAEDPLFILYTSGSTGKPKGVLHTTAGYLLYAAVTHKYIFDYHDNDIYWCTADVGWITGHTYIVYGPLCNGATTLMFEGVPTYPSASRYWDVVDKHQVNIFYTAPTAIRSLMREGEKPIKQTSRKSLRLLGTVGEPINPDVWTWYYKTVGDERCPVVDTWWQTETGGILISPLPGATILKPGSATKPFFGIEPGFVDQTGNYNPEANEGALVIKKPWPGMMRTVYGDHERFIQTLSLIHI